MQTLLGRCFTYLFLMLMLSALSYAQKQVQDIAYSKDGKTYRFEIEGVEKIAKPASDQLETASGGKSPLLAGVLSFVIPGAGQIYNGDTFWGIVHAGLAAGGIVTALTLGYETETYRNTQLVGEYNPYFHQYFYNYKTVYSYEDVETPWLYVGLGVAGATMIWSVIDAVLTAGNSNDDGHSSIKDHPSDSWNIAVVPSQGGWKARVSIRF